MIKSQLVLPTVVANNLKCVECKGYLSVPPIMVDLKKNAHICGRCYEPNANAEFEPYTAYETLAQLTVFPCSYTAYGCSKYLPWQIVYDHEKICTFQPYSCPILPPGTCSWKGTTKKIREHFTKFHPNFMSSMDFIKMPEHDNSIFNYLLEYRNAIFLLQIQRETKEQSWISICNLENNVTFHYDIVIESSESDRKVTFQGNKVLQTPHWARELKSSLYNLSYLEEVLDDKNVQFKVSIYDSLTCQEVDNEPAAPNEKNLMLEELECPVCKEYMKSPIFNCTGGHSVCSTCKPKLAKCPICSSFLSNARNYSLEAIIKYLKFKCKNELCSYQAKIDAIATHEKQCSHINNHEICPLKKYQICSWKGAPSELYAHIEGYHTEMPVMKLNIVQKIDLMDIVNQTRSLAKFNKQLFLIEIYHSYNTLGFVVQHLGNHSKPVYEFKITFVNCRNSGEKLILTGSSHCKAEIDEIADSLIVMVDSLKPYINEEHKVFFTLDMFIIGSYHLDS